MDALSKIKIGTCAWSYDDWRGTFYPEHLPGAERLPFYSKHFSAVEVDSTFYHAPTASVTQHWLDITPPDFTFACKLPREITHDRKLRDCEEPLRHFLEGMEPLRPKLTCLLVQLPPYFEVRHDELALRTFIRSLPSGWRWAIELRKSEWHMPRIARLFEDHGICWVWNDITTLDRADEGPFEFHPETADFLYVRLLGDLDTKNNVHGTRTHSDRELNWPRDAALDAWAARLRQQLDRVKRIVVFSGNHFEGFAPQTVVRLAERLGIEIQLPGEPAEEEQQLDLL